MTGRFACDSTHCFGIPRFVAHCREAGWTAFRSIPRCSLSRNSSRLSQLKMAEVHTDIWNTWNASGGPKYPHEKVIQYCFRNFPPEQRSSVRALDVGCGGGVHTAFLAAEGFN